MQDALEAMRGYFSDEAWTKWGERYFHDWPSAAWRALFRDIESSLDEDPGSERAQDLLARSTKLWQGDIESDTALLRAVREGYGKAWSERGSLAAGAAASLRRIQDRGYRAVPRRRLHGVLAPPRPGPDVYDRSVDRLARRPT